MKVVFVILLCVIFYGVGRDSMREHTLVAISIDGTHMPEHFGQCNGAEIGPHIITVCPVEKYD